MEDWEEARNMHIEQLKDCKTEFQLIVTLETIFWSYNKNIREFNPNVTKEEFMKNVGILEKELQTKEVHKR